MYDALPLLKSTVSYWYRQLLLALATEPQHDGGGIRRTKFDR